MICWKKFAAKIKDKRVCLHLGLDGGVYISRSADAVARLFRGGGLDVTRRVLSVTPKSPPLKRRATADQTIVGDVNRAR
jgi:hypothetical protein